jgi:ubiquinone/menaquinone biosynthesis C-methylase UbiE
MDHFKEIYANQASQYHRMINAEDIESNLLQAIESIVKLEGNVILDLGSGTGRIPLLFESSGAKIIALDLNFPMLREQKIQRERVKSTWDLLQADMRLLPFSGRKIDVVFAGWAIGHLRSWYDLDWQSQIGQVLVEMHRMAKPHAVLMIMETLTTGSLTPAAPTPELAQYYEWLETEWGFSRSVISTDYQFNNIEQAVEYTEFFFGADLAEAIRKNNWTRLPEWTGIWHKQLDLSQ